MDANRAHTHTPYEAQKLALKGILQPRGAQKRAIDINITVLKIDIRGP